MWWKAWGHWERGWTTMVVQKPACGTDLQSKLNVLREESFVL